MITKDCLKLLRNILYSAMGIMLIAFLLIPTISYAQDGSSSFQIDFIDVGQGDAALVQCDGIICS